MPRGSFTSLKAVERILTLSLEIPPAEVVSVRIVPIEERVDLAVDTFVSIESKETAAWSLIFLAACLAFSNAV